MQIELVAQGRLVPGVVAELQSHGIGRHARLALAIAHVDLNEFEQIAGLLLELLVFQGEHGLADGVLGPAEHVADGQVLAEEALFVDVEVALGVLFNVSVCGRGGRRSFAPYRRRRALEGSRLERAGRGGHVRRGYGQVEGIHRAAERAGPFHDGRVERAGLVQRLLGSRPEGGRRAGRHELRRSRSPGRRAGRHVRPWSFAAAAASVCHAAVVERKRMVVARVRFGVLGFDDDEIGGQLTGMMRRLVCLVLDRFGLEPLGRDGREKELSVVVVLLEVLTLVQVLERRRVLHVGHAFVIGKVVAVVVLLGRMPLGGHRRVEPMIAVATTVVVAMTAMAVPLVLVLLVIRAAKVISAIRRPAAAAGGFLRERRRVSESVAGQFGLLQNVLLKGQEVGLGLGVQVVIVVDVGVERHGVVDASPGSAFRIVGSGGSGRAGGRLKVRNWGRGGRRRRYGRSGRFRPGACAVLRRPASSGGQTGIAGRVLRR